MPITINLNGIDGVMTAINKTIEQAEEGTHQAIATFVKNVERQAKDDAPANNGMLRGSIDGDVSGLKGSVTVRANYAAYLEFGTRKFAAIYVATLPADWQAYALTFKGKGGGTLDEFIQDIMQWVQQKGIGGLKTKSGNVSESKSSLDAMQQAAYAIALNILQNGIRPHPFLFPQVKESGINYKTLVADIKNVFK